MKALSTIFIKVVKNPLKDGAFFVTAHTFCATWNGPRNAGFLRTVPTWAEVFFAQFMTILEMQMVARAIEI